MICSICLSSLYIYYCKCDCKCNSYYHKSCITNWYKRKKSCPICRKYQNIEPQRRLNNILFLFIFLLYISFFLVKSYEKQLLFTHHIFGIIFRASLIPIGFSIIYYYYITNFTILLGFAYLMTNIFVVIRDYQNNIQIDNNYLIRIAILNFLSILIIYSTTCKIHGNPYK